MKPTTKNSTIELLLDDARGIYIPQAFYKGFDFDTWGLKLDDYKELSSPDNEGYWDAWDDLIRDAAFHDKATTDDDEDHIWHLYQDGCLFAVRNDHDWGNEE